MPKAVPPLAFAAALLLSACTLPPQPGSSTPRINAEQARAIAAQDLASRDARTIVMKPTFVELYETSENRCLPTEIHDAQSQQRIKDFESILTNRRYYLVMYEPTNDVLFGSTICVFVDDTGHILTRGPF
jgi:hypothetical protein